MNLHEALAVTESQSAASSTRAVARDRLGTELSRLHAIERAAEDWASEAARRFDFLSATERALYRAVRGGA